MTVETTNAGAAAPANETSVAAAATETTVTTATEAAAPAETAAAKPTLDQDLRKVWDKLHQPREGGKFAKRDGAPETTADGEAGAADPAAVDPATPKSPDQPKEGGKAETTAAAASIDPPHSWSAEKKALWASVPPEAQTYIAQREAEAHQAITRAGEQVKTFEPIRNVIEHYGETFRKAGLHPAEGIDRLLDVERQLQSDAPSAIKRIAEAYKVDLHRLTGQQPAVTTDPATPGTEGLPPIVSTLQTQLAETRAELTKVTSYLTAQQRTQIEGENAALARQIADFAKDKPHFDTVRKHMAGLMQSGAAETLDDAYDQAVHAHKGIRTRIQEDARKAEEDKAAKDRAAKAAEARKSNAVNVKSGAGSNKAPPTMDDTLREVARKAYGQ